MLLWIANLGYAGVTQGEIPFKQRAFYYRVVPSPLLGLALLVGVMLLGR